MKIQFDNLTQLNTGRITTSYSSTRTQESEKTGAYRADISGTVMDNNAYGVHGRTTEEVMQEAQLTDVSTQRDYMAVMSNSMSGEDFSRMLKEGANPNDTDIETVVTIIDRIKAELMKSGVRVEGYTDNLDQETLAQIVGSESLATQLRDAFVKNDIPVTKENMKTAAEAVQKATHLDSLSDGEMKYMVNNSMDPTIDNLYMAQHSGAADADRQGRGYYQEGNGYYARKAETPDFDKLQPQMERILAEAGLEVTKENLQQAEWLVEKGIPLTTENLLCLNQNSKASLPVSEAQAVEAVTAVMTEGKQPAAAKLTENTGKYQKATEVSAYVERLLQDESLSITARRQLEEVRLRMTAEVNVRLIESGFSIDTSDMENLIEALKQAEAEQAQRMFPDQTGEQAAANMQLYQNTLEQTAKLPGLPAAVLGRLVFDLKISVNVENLASEGEKTKADYEKISEAYETLMTEPRKDLGDSIRKAFGNVDDILTDLGYELTYENQRAVRILSYNQIAITPQNIEQIREADRKVARVISKMTPSATLKMIRDGVNPLSTDMSELEQYFGQQDEQPEEAMETYSRYLYQLEKNNEVTPEERDAYIGVYRLLRQIEKSDGAVIGSVIKSQSELNFKQLLTAARTAKKAGMNILVDESFGGLTEMETTGKGIDEQLNHIEAQYRQEEYEQTCQMSRSALQADKEKSVLDLLNRLDLPVTLNHLMAASALTESAGPLFQYLRSKTSQEEEKKEKAATERSVESSMESDVLSEWSDSLLDSLTDKESMQTAYKEFTENAKELLTESLYEPGQTSLDIKAMKSACLQISVAQKLSGEETYEIPVVLNEETVAVRLTIQHKEGEYGQAAIRFESGEEEKIQAFLQLRTESVTVHVTGQGKETEFLQKVQEDITQKLTRRGFSKQENISSRSLYEASKMVIGALKGYLQEGAR